MLLAPGASPVAAPQLPRVVRHGPPPLPFAFEPRTRPSPEFEPLQLQQWLQAVASHRPGESDESARSVAALSPDTIADIISAFELGATVPIDDRLERIATIRRATVLHTDIAVTAVDLGYLDQMNDAMLASDHLGVALELLGFLKRQSQGGQDPFVLAWWKAVAAILGSHREAVSSVAFMRRAVSEFPADPDILMMAGALGELAASPMIQDDAEAGDDVRAERGSEAANLRNAEQRYREALAIDPGLVEARVRLGRVLAHQGRHDAALVELRAVSDSAAGRKLRYYRDLFIGEAEEGRHRDEAAREAYRRALSLYPGAQSAHLALARAERRAGSRSRELETVARLLKLPMREDASQDPWRDYFVVSPARRQAEWLEQLRWPFRRPQ